MRTPEPHSSAPEADEDAEVVDASCARTCVVPYVSPRVSSLTGEEAVARAAFCHEGTYWRLRDMRVVVWGARGVGPAKFAVTFLSEHHLILRCTTDERGAKAHGVEFAPLRYPRVLLPFGELRRVFGKAKVDVEPAEGATPAVVSWPAPIFVIPSIRSQAADGWNRLAALHVIDTQAGGGMRVAFLSKTTANALPVAVAPRFRDRDDGPAPPKLCEDWAHAALAARACAIRPTARLPKRGQTA